MAARVKREPRSPQPWSGFPMGAPRGTAGWGRVKREPAEEIAVKQEPEEEEEAEGGDTEPTGASTEGGRAGPAGFPFRPRFSCPGAPLSSRETSPPSGGDPVLVVPARRKFPAAEAALSPAWFPLLLHLRSFHGERLGKKPVCLFLARCPLQSPFRGSVWRIWADLSRKGCHGEILGPWKPAVLAHQAFW